MGDTWITELTHFLDEAGSIADMPRPARLLAEFLARIVMSATLAAAGRGDRGRPSCRRRPNRKPCPGKIENFIDADSDAIRWECPICGDNGQISGWRGTLWDCTRPQAVQH